MMERQIVVISTGGKEAVALLRGIRASGVFGVMTGIKQPEIPQEARGMIVIGGECEGMPEAMQALLQRGLPLMAFGAPAAALCAAMGGSVRGKALEEQCLKEVRFANLGVCAGVEGGMRMLQGAEYLTLPQGCRTLSVVEGVILGFEDEEEKRIGFQFLPETQDIEVSSIVENFLWQICGLEPEYSCEKYAEDAIERIRAQVGDGQAICLLSGGVDSTTAACLAREAVGEKLHCLVIDTGLSRPGEVDAIVQELGEGMGFPIRRINASGRMMETLRSCVTPQQKRHAVQVFLAARIADEAVRIGGDVVVVQGTNYLDLMQVEHSPMELPGSIPTVRPLEYLFKEEVRQTARGRNVPEQIVQRQHYPSAGLALRCMGIVDAEKLETLRRADAIVRQTLEESSQKKSNAQVFALLADVTELFFAEEKRYVVVLRAAASSGEGQTAIRRLPQDVLERAAERIVEEVENVYRVVFDVTPGKVEWE